MGVEWTREYLDELQVYRAEKIKTAEASLATAQWDLRSAEKNLKWWQESIPFDLHWQRKEDAERVAYYAEKEQDAHDWRADKARHEKQTSEMWVVLFVVVILASTIGAIFR